VAISMEKFFFKEENAMSNLQLHTFDLLNMVDVEIKLRCLS